MPSKTFCSRYASWLFLGSTHMLQEMLTSVEQVTQQRDAAQNELEMARDTARTYYHKMLQAESANSRMKTSMVAMIACL